jgi:hypothetical protein
MKRIIMKSKVSEVGISVTILALMLTGCLQKAQPTQGDATAIDVAVLTTAEQVLSNDMVTGRVVNEEGFPIRGAIVRLQASTLFVMSDADGRFTLSGLPARERIRITAYAKGYFIKEADTVGGAADVSITLVQHDQSDNPDYEFLSAGITAVGGGENTGCAECHAATEDEAADEITLPFDEWVLDAHAGSSLNPRFLSMFNGTDLAGNQSLPTRYIIHRDYGSLPLPPDNIAPYYGPGFQLDFPGSAGNCATCHLPVMAIDEPFTSDPNTAEGVELEGVTCDFCHKVWDVGLNPSTGLPYPNMTGVLSYEFRRPSEEHQFFAGPFDDVAPGEDTYSALENESQFCAPCHFGEFWGTLVYNSFGEWLASPYAEQGSETFRTCQDCHMPPLGIDHFARFEAGANVRDPDLIFSHRMPGAADQGLLENTAELHLDVAQEGGRIIVETSVFNAFAGHHIPTDSPLRQIFLQVEAMDEDGQPLALLEGPTLPQWAGNLAGKPGTYFAKILERLWTEEQPTGAYWAQTRLVEDTRLGALETSESTFDFRAPDDGGVTISASLIFRRAFFDLMLQKGWEIPDILMEHVRIEVELD